MLFAPLRKIYHIAKNISGYVSQQGQILNLMSHVTNIIHSLLKKCPSTVREETVYLSMLSAVTQTL